MNSLELERVVRQALAMLSPEPGPVVSVTVDSLGLACVRFAEPNMARQPESAFANAALYEAWERAVKMNERMSFLFNDYTA